MRPLGLNDAVYLLLALRWTIVLSVIAAIGGSIIGLAIAFARLSPNRIRRWPALAYIRVVQGTPLLIQLFLLFFGSDMVGFPLSAWLSAILGLSMNAGAFFGEIWRGCIEQVPLGQWEAAQSLGLRYYATMRRVVLPQAVRLALAPTVGFLVGLIKSTSVAAIIGFVELTRAGQLLNNSTFRPFTIFGGVACLYLLLCWPLTLASQRIERRLALAQRTSQI